MKANIKANIKEWIENEEGAFGIKEIAFTVAVIIIIGFIIAAVQSNIGVWVTQVWDMFINQIEDLM